MDQPEIQLLLDCLPKERTLYPYCRDYYAAQLLQLAAERHPTIGALKGSRFGRLLDKPPIKQLIGRYGNGRLDPNILASYWCDPGGTYLLTVGQWGSQSGRYDQTSRPGYNLVLRLNFNQQHDRTLRDTLRPSRDGLFNYCEHPQLRRGERPYYRETLAWARLDIGLDQGEVLIEEIQSDWVRDVEWLRSRLERCNSPDSEIRGYGFVTTARQAKRYLAFLDPLIRDWSQATLSATLWFVHHELGLQRIWYHAWETGSCLKRIGRYGAPPRSLYTQLPRQFCFEQTDRLPGFLDDRHTHRRLRRAKIEPRCFCLEL